MTKGQLAEELWTTSSRRVVHRGRVVISEHSVQLPDGQPATYEVDESVPFAVATLVYDGERVCLARQYRHPIGQWIFDLPGGAGETGESPLQAAHRELEEELGLVGMDLQPLHTFYVNPGRSAWPVHIFFCRTTVPGEVLVDDPAEQVRLNRMSLAQLDALITANEIVDPTLLIARFMAAVTGLMPPITSTRSTP